MKTSKVLKSTENVNDDSVGCGCCISSHPNLDQFFGAVAQESTFHGVKYIGSKKLHTVERVFWTIVFLTCFGFGVFLVYRVLAKYHMSPIIVSFQNEETAVSQLPFPAITICSVNLLKKSVLDGLTKEVDYLVERLTELLQNSTEDSIIHNQTYLQMVWEVGAHLDHLGQFCLQAPSFLGKLNVSADARGVAENVKKLNDILQKIDSNVTEKFKNSNHTETYSQTGRHIFHQASMNCEDMLVNCMWAGTVISCKEIFFPIHTRHGLCCTFNMMPKFLLYKISEDGRHAKRDKKNIPADVIYDWRRFVKDDLIIKDPAKLADIKYPKHQKAGGKHYGLTVLANPDLKEYSTCSANDGWGFKVVAHSPLSSPSIMEYGAAVPPDSEAFLDMEPQVTVDSDVSEIPLVYKGKRGCYLADDPEAWLKDYNYYSAENCFSECWANHTLKRCGCVEFFMPRNDSVKLCGAKMRPCARSVAANLTSNIGKQNACGRCLPSCEEILYRMQVSHFDIRKDEYASYVTYNDSEGVLKNATNYSILHVYIGTGSLYAKERKKLYDAADLIANAGGLLGLTLGISIISLVEIVYMFTLRAWFRFYHGGERVNSCTPVRNHLRITDAKKVDGYYNWAVKSKFSMNETGANTWTVGKSSFMF